VAPNGTRPSRTAGGANSNRNTVGTSGASARIRRTAKGENDITVTATPVVAAPAAVLRPYRWSIATSRSSTAERNRDGCLVSISRRNGRPAASTSCSSSSRVRMPGPPLAPRQAE
jgi:hypothetical protein